MGGSNTPKRTRGVSIKKVILALVMAAFVPSLIFQTLLMLMYVPSESMYPALTGGDTLIGLRLYSDIERGNIVAFQTESMIMIKRVIGLPGETVYVDSNGVVSINGVELEEPYVINQRAGREQFFEVPDGCLLLFGDNRANSYDARYWEDPYVNESAVLAIAKYKLNGGKSLG